MAQSKIRTAANGIVVAAAVIAAIVCINIVDQRLFVRADITEDKIYKLSPASRDIVANLPDRLTIKAYISGGLAPPLNTTGRYVRDVLDEYAAASHGKVVWEAIDPTDGTKEERQAKEEELKKYGIQKITLERVTDSKVEVGSDNYLGIGFQYEGNVQAIPQVVRTEGLEYQITGVIKRLVAAKKKKVAFATSEGELSPNQGAQIASKILEDQGYDVTTTDLEKPTSDDVDALVILGPRKAFTDKARYQIDQFLMKGKPVALFLDGMTLETPNGMNMPGQEQPRIGRGNDVNLQDLLKTWGVDVHQDMLFDDQNTVGVVPVGGQMFLVNHPAFVKITEKQFSGAWAVTDKMKGLIVPYASSVALTGDLKDGKEAGVKATAIAMTSPLSWRTTGFYLFNPQQAPAKGADVGPYPIGYAIEGKIKSAFPNGLGGDAAQSSPDAGKPNAPDGTRLVVLGDSDLLNDANLPLQQVPIYSTNLLFFVNTLDWMMHDESLVALRVKGMAARPLNIDNSASTRFWMRFDIAGIPILLVLFGIVLWQLRTARRRKVVY